MPDPADSPSSTASAAGWGRDLRIAAGFLTRLPVAPKDIAAEGGSLARAMALFPIIGAGIGAFGGLVLLAGFELGFGPLASAFLAVAATVAITGALHEDGLADVADGLGGGSDREARLRIMRDSRTGAYGVLAIVFSVGLRVSLLSAFFTPGEAALALIAVGALSRAPMAPMAYLMGPARTDGLAAAAGRPDRTAVAIAKISALVIALVIIDVWAAIVAAIAVAVAAGWIAILAARRLGGHTGDVFGVAQQVSEIAALATIVAMQ